MGLQSRQTGPFQPVHMIVNHFSRGQEPGTDRHAQPVQNGDIARGVSEPNILKMNLDTHIVLSDVTSIEREKFAVVVILFSHPNDSFRRHGCFCNVWQSSVSFNSKRRITHLVRNSTTVLLLSHPFDEVSWRVLHKGEQDETHLHHGNIYHNVLKR